MDKTKSRDGTVIAYERSGDGPPVILISGASCDRQANGPLAGLLAQRFTVLNYDRRGRGSSGDTPPYAIDREIEDIAALVAEAGGSAALWGSSSGAALGLLAAAAGVSVTRLAMWEPPYQLDDDAPRRNREYLETLTGHLDAGRRGDAAALFMTLVGLPDEMIAGARTQPFWPGMEALAPTLAYDATIMGDGGIPAGAALVSAPTLVVTGGASPPWFAAGADALVAALPDGRRAVLPGQSHDFAADALAPVLIDFLV